MEDRRTLIADSAIEVIAREGVRALTHRAVDAEAGLASGSTSYYCRTRAQLITLTVERVVALLRGYVEHCGVQEVRPADARGLAVFLAEMEKGLLSDYHAELAARQALIIELAGTDATADLVASLLDPSDISGALDAVGVKKPDTAASSLLTVLEGRLWERTFGRLGVDGPDFDSDADLFEAVLGGSGKPGGRGGLFGLRR